MMRLMRAVVVRIGVNSVYLCLILGEGHYGDSAVLTVLVKFTWR